MRAAELLSVNPTPAARVAGSTAAASALKAQLHGLVPAQEHAADLQNTCSHMCNPVFLLIHLQQQPLVAHQLPYTQAAADVQGALHQHDDQSWLALPHQPRSLVSRHRQASVTCLAVLRVQALHGHQGHQAPASILYH